MKRAVEICLSLAVCAGAAIAGEAGVVKIAAAPVTWADALPSISKRQAVFVLDTPSQTEVRGYLNAAALRGSGEVGKMLEGLAGEAKVDLRIEWPDGFGKPTGFGREVMPAAGLVRSSYRVGSTTITRTFFAAEEEGAVFIHLIANQPGALNFKVTVRVTGGMEPEIEDRRQMIVSPVAGQPGRLGARVWVLPFESDVAKEGNGIMVKGEGEALIVCNYAAGGDLSGTLAKLGARYDPGHTPADPSKIWHGVLDSRLKSVENSP
ncbi:MAG: glycoside hydrolase N-terminal domain-containing protein [Verrucomicrobiota bacterium]